jgi:signal transduction histidine kinase
MAVMTTLPDPWQRARPWVPDALAGLLTFLLGVVEARGDHVVVSRAGEYLVVLGVAVAVGLSRRLPGAALAVAWGVGFVHLSFGTGPLVVEVLLAVVAFGCARWGSTAVVWLSGISIPVGAVIAVSLLDPNVLYDALDSAGIQVLARSYSGGDGWRLPAGLLATGLLMAPWLLGLALRFSERSEVSRASQVVAEAERDQAAEIARLREDQARLARDVHDVVGHSLAVILAQAESAQYLDDTDSVGLKRTMANIATSARTSLDDVRSVLATTQGAPRQPVTQQPDLEALLDGVRASGHVVESAVVGTPQPMPPELEVVAFRVLQEMLTNAIKHGRRDEPVVVERHWEGDLRIEVRNAVADGPPLDETQPIAGDSGPAAPPVEGGQGIEGMRRRLEAVGGRLDVRRRTDPQTFTATAWIPVRVSS